MDDANVSGNDLHSNSQPIRKSSRFGASSMYYFVSL